MRAVLAEFDKRLALHKLGTPFVSPLKEHGAPITLSEYRDWFLDSKKTAIRKGRPVHPKTQYSYKHAMNTLISAVGNVRISLAPPQIRTFEASLERYSVTSRSIIVRMLRAAWAFGMEEGILSENPFRKISISKDRKIPAILNTQEMDRIFEKIEDLQTRLGFSLARHAGLRRVEICRNVRWQDVDFDSKTLTIPEGKTGPGQRVPILPPLLAILKANRKEEGFIVDLRQDTFTHRVKEARRAAGVNKPGAVRILRHTLGAGLLSQKVDIRTIQLLLRHSDISTTQIYTQIPVETLGELLKGKKT